MKNKEYIDINVASYALADTILALNNCGVKEICITKCDGDIYIRISKDYLEKAVYGTLDTSVSCGCENEVDADLSELGIKLKENEVTKEIDKLIVITMHLQRNCNMDLSGIVGRARDIRKMYKERLNDEIK